MRKEWLSESRFAQTRVALHNYHQDCGSFPPTKYQPKANGPIHSWRVLLYPYADMDARKLYSKYDFSEHWNSPGNLAVARSMSSWGNYYSMEENDIANYLAIGDGDDWPSDKPLKARLITKGKDRFLLVEYPDSKIRWMEPEY